MSGSGQRFHRFTQKAKWLRKYADAVVNVPYFPDFIETEILHAWAHDCFPWRGTEDWDRLVANSARRIVERHPWLAPFESQLQNRISNC